ncbi:Clavaminate synthase-like protein [Auricularia subglabra TFB-10046 SS5]|nr:Clavaminate synthase-like protein [Auricularia subglabra TFB-10046 SS5]
MSNRYKSDDFPRCLSCTRRWAGDTCRFQNVRLLLRDGAGVLRAIDFLEKPVMNLPAMMYPDSWNKPLAPEYIHRVKVVAARDLIGTLREERAHLMLPKLVRRVRETDCRATCDTCLTSVFAGSWICTSCGREACSDCHSKIVEICGDPEKKQRTLDASPFFLTCTRKQEHTVDNYRPISRFSLEEVDEAIHDMERLLAAEPPKLDSPMSAVPELSPPSDRTSSSSSLHPSPGPLSLALTNGAPRTLSNGSSIDPSVEDHSEQRWCTMLPDFADAGLPYRSVRLFTHAELDPASFRQLWAAGEPIVVEGLLDLCKIRWTPEYFIQEYGSESCLVVECQNDVNRRITVEEFFTKFGDYEDRQECWKLKDWPSSTDFKSVFPQLFEDFMNIVPMPDYSRRDGVLNISSHFPTNTVGPDLGPKMYNAYASTLDSGSKGSTRLHMDMADAVNIMHHAMKRLDGGEGGAVWDIFSADDSPKLRRFIRSRFKDKCQNGVDPIHSQLFYLDTELLDDLYNETGVISYRIYQRPGEAVFIPAGCAHQVCNLSDCIKVAVDFVSPENVERCERLTQEFREQNQVTPWKEDILQLKTMLWYAWLSCSIVERRAPSA